MDIAHSVLLHRSGVKSVLRSGLSIIQSFDSSGKKAVPQSVVGFGLDGPEAPPRGLTVQIGGDPGGRGLWWCCGLSWGSDFCWCLQGGALLMTLWSTFSSAAVQLANHSEMPWLKTDGKKAVSHLSCLSRVTSANAASFVAFSPVQWCWMSRIDPPWCEPRNLTLSPHSPHWWPQAACLLCSSQLFGFGGVEDEVVGGAPWLQPLHLLLVCSLTSSCIICKLDDGIVWVGGGAVMAIEGKE